MTDLTRRKFLTGTPAVVAGVVVGVAAAPATARLALTVNPMSGFRETVGSNTILTPEVIYREALAILDRVVVNPYRGPGLRRPND